MSLMMEKLYTALIAAKVPEEQARAAAVEAAEPGDFSRLATKADLAALSASTKADLAELRLATKADLAELKASLLQWMVGSLIAITAVFATIVKLL